MNHFLIYMYITADGNVTVVPPYDCVHVSDRTKEIVKVQFLGSVCVVFRFVDYFAHRHLVCMLFTHTCHSTCKPFASNRKYTKAGKKFTPGGT